jgi:hypothetical protein
MWRRAVDRTGSRDWQRRALRGGLRLGLVGLLLGAVYSWAGPRLYPAGSVFGFGWGMAHGACMPLALPALVLGRDVPIYAEPNTGRGYKLGYIVGINLCGLVFFGGAFWRPRRERADPTQNQRER